jgi:hypothetical protein
LRRETVESLLIVQGLRLKEFQPAGGGQLLDGARRWAQAAAGGPVRLREHQRDIVARIEQACKRARCKLGSAGEN